MRERSPIRLAATRHGGDATVTVEQEVDRLAVLVDGAVQKIPLRLGRGVRLVHRPRGANRLVETPPALLGLRNAAGHPPKRGRMGHLNAALCHHFDQVPVRQPLRDVPPHAQLDAVGVKHSFAADRVRAIGWVIQCLGQDSPGVYSRPRMHQNPGPASTAARPGIWSTFGDGSPAWFRLSPPRASSRRDSGSPHRDRTASRNIPMRRLLPADSRRCSARACRT